MPPQGFARPNVLQRALNRWVALQTFYKVVSITGVVVMVVLSLVVVSFSDSSGAVKGKGVDWELAVCVPETIHEAVVFNDGFAGGRCVSLRESTLIFSTYTEDANQIYDFLDHRGAVFKAVGQTKGDLRD